MREFYIFRNSVEEIFAILGETKRRIEAFGYTIAGSIVESVEENFNRDYSAADEAVFH